MEKLFIFGDVHAPYHDKKAVSCMLKALDVFKPDRVIDMGDFFDCYSVSAYKKDPRRKARLVDEVNMAIPLLRTIEDAAGKADLIRLLGNHEDRLDRHLEEPKNHALHGAVSLDSLADLSGWQVVGYERAIQLGKVRYTHDLGFTGKYALQHTLHDAERSTVIGHTHQMGMVFEGRLSSKTRVCASFGWLGDPKKADYMHKDKKARYWCHGFGLAFVANNGVTRFSSVSRSCIRASFSERSFTS